MTRYFKAAHVATPDPMGDDVLVFWESESQPSIDIHVDDDLTFTGLYDERGQAIYRTDKIRAGFSRKRP